MTACATAWLTALTATMALPPVAAQSMAAEPPPAFSSPAPTGTPPPSAATPPPNEVDFPLETGTFWLYRETYTEHLGELDSSQQDTTRFEVRGSPSRRFILQAGGFDPAPGPVERGAGHLRLAPWTGEDALPWPLEIGLSAPGGDGRAGFTVEAREDVTVPAGTFSAFRCALRTRGSEAVLWIAPGVGVVRETQGRPGRRPEIERVLTAWGRPERRAE